jgi:CO/xanthine dehydrogenase Mo-binding subunit
MISACTGRASVAAWANAAPAPLSAAISNAVFDAIGVRLRSVPFTPQKTLALINS